MLMGIEIEDYFNYLPAMDHSYITLHSWLVLHIFFGRKFLPIYVEVDISSINRQEANAIMQPNWKLFACCSNAFPVWKRWQGARRDFWGRQNSAPNQGAERPDAAQFLVKVKIKSDVPFLHKFCWFWGYLMCWFQKWCPFVAATT